MATREELWGSRQDQSPLPPLLSYLLPPAQPENQGKLNDAKWTPEGIFFPALLGASQAAVKYCLEARRCISELWFPARTVAEGRRGKAGDGILFVVELFHPKNTEVLVNICGVTDTEREECLKREQTPGGGAAAAAVVGGSRRENSAREAGVTLRPQSCCPLRVGGDQSRSPGVPSHHCHPPASPTARASAFPWNIFWFLPFGSSSRTSPVHSSQWPHLVPPLTLGRARLSPSLGGVNPRASEPPSPALTIPTLF